MKFQQKRNYEIIRLEEETSSSGIMFLFSSTKFLILEETKDFENALIFSNFAT
jgi:hypothetical protein